ncbi:hypothetical protein Tco_0537214 [Tanacetum coccineum]
MMDSRNTLLVSLKADVIPLNQVKTVTVVARNCHDITWVCLAKLDGAGAGAVVVAFAGGAGVVAGASAVAEKDENCSFSFYSGVWQTSCNCKSKVQNDIIGHINNKPKSLANNK